MNGVFVCLCMFGMCFVYLCMRAFMYIYHLKPDSVHTKVNVMQTEIKLLLKIKLLMDIRHYRFIKRLSFVECAKCSI